MWKTLWKKILCYWYGHQFYIVQEFSDHSRRIHCPHCGTDLAMNDWERCVIPWNDEFSKMYRGFGHIIIKPWR